MSNILANEWKSSSERSYRLIFEKLKNIRVESGENSSGVKDGVKIVSESELFLILKSMNFEHIRVIRPEEFVTMDLRLDRLNVILDGEGNIVDIKFY
jgi:hypothetical protein